MSTPAELYKRCLRKGDIARDLAQEHAVESLQQIYQDLFQHWKGRDDSRSLDRLKVSNLSLPRHFGRDWSRYGPRSPPCSEAR